MRLESLSIFMLVNPYDGMLSLEGLAEQKQSTARDQQHMV